MRAIWGESHRRRLWRHLWVALAEAQCAMGIVTVEQVADLRDHQDAIDEERARSIETEIQHEIMAEIRTYAEQCRIGGRIIHLGATSSDILDNTDAIRIRESLDIVISLTQHLLREMAARIRELAETPAMGFTHLQAAEPTTVGYRLAQYGQDVLCDLMELRHVRGGIKGKGFKGTVGTSASYCELMNLDAGRVRIFEERVMAAVGLPAYPVTTQIYPRKQDLLVLNVLASLACSLHRFAFDLRILQSPGFAEWTEPAAPDQVSSSAMPFKRNPVNSELIDSLARFVASLPRVTWDNAAHSLLERTLDDSANRREVLPTAFLAVDEIVRRATRIFTSMEVDADQTLRNLRDQDPLASTERLLLACVQRGGDRQVIHEALRRHVLEARSSARPSQLDALRLRLATDPAICSLISPEDLGGYLTLVGYTGDAPQRARELAATIDAALADGSK
jgi:adenylosuccinate lyase